MDVDPEDVVDAAAGSALLALLWAGYRRAVRLLWRHRKDADLKIEHEVKSVAGELRRVKREIEESFKGAPRRERK